MAHSTTTPTIRRIWIEALNLNEVGLHDNFFDLGGHSQLLFKVQLRLQEAFNRELSIVELCRYPTISALARYFAGDAMSGPSLQPSYERAERQRRAISQRNPNRSI